MPTPKRLAAVARDLHRKPTAVDLGEAILDAQAKGMRMEDIAAVLKRNVQQCYRWRTAAIERNEQ